MEMNQIGICDECEINGIFGEYFCEDCDLMYCELCNKQRHRKGNLKKHKRIKLIIPSPVQVSSHLNHLNDILQNPSNWDKNQVILWLIKIQLPQYKDIFLLKNINGPLLLNINDENYLENELKVGMRIHRKRILREIQKLICQEKNIIQNNTSFHINTTNNIINDKKELIDIRIDPIQINEENNILSNIYQHHPSPVTASRTRAIQGRKNSLQGRVLHKSSSKNLEIYKKNDLDNDENKNIFELDISECKKSRNEGKISNRRAAQALGLELDLEQVHIDNIKSVQSSYNFSDEGILQTQGFEINKDGIRNVPLQYHLKNKKSNHTPQNLLNNNKNHTFNDVSPISTKINIGIKESLIMLEELGQGAGGKVFKALHVPTLKLVAVKVVRIYEQEKRHQMVRELKSLYSNVVSISEFDSCTSVSHACTYLVAFYDAFTNPDTGCVSIVLEYMGSGSLESLVNSNKKCSEKTLANIAFSVLKGLAFLHENHQLHRDIKPSNILVSTDGQVKISDFGISRDLENTLAKATTFTGTLIYMAPERISGGNYSYPSDIWSFGLVLMACAINKVPLPSEDGYWGVVHAVQDQPSPKLSDYGDFSNELCDFLDLTLKKNPFERPSASKLLEHPFIKNNIESIQNHLFYEYFNDDKIKENNTLNKKYQEFVYLLKKIKEWYIQHSIPFNFTKSPTILNHSFNIQNIETKKYLDNLIKQLEMPEEMVLHLYKNIIC